MNRSAAPSRPVDLAAVGVGPGPNSDRLGSLAETICRSWRVELRARLERLTPGWMDGSAARVSAQTGDGLAFLAGLAGGIPGAPARLKAVHALARIDARFEFVERLPASCGFGLAIGRTLEQALGIRSSPVVLGVTASLQMFMTLLDGLVDHAPELLGMTPGAFCRRLEGGGKKPRLAPSQPVEGKHPLVWMAWELRTRWQGEVRALSAAGRGNVVLQAFRKAVRGSLRAEAGTSGMVLGLDPGDRRFDEACLWERTRLPHWAQALVPLLGGIPSRLSSLEEYQEFIFAIGDYAAWLDDMRDLLEDLREGRWNTVLLELHRLQPFGACPERERRQRLLQRIADGGVSQLLVDRAVTMLSTIRGVGRRAGLKPDPIEPLLADLSFVYLAD